MGKHVVVGAGAVGSAVAKQLVARGDEVVIVTRRGVGVPGARAEAGDAADGAALSRIAAGADALYNCANPAQYHRWPEIWPPIAAAMLRAAEESGAVLAIMGNLYGYGPVDVPMTEDMPQVATTVKGAIRAKMWHDALALHEAGRIRVTEVRASDYLGYKVNGVLGEMVLAFTAKNKTSWAVARVDMPHSWTTTGDAAKTLVAVATDPRAWGRAWHAPTPPAISIRDAADRANELIGAPKPTIREVPYPVFVGITPFSPMMRAMKEMNYQFRRPFHLDSSLTERTFGLVPTPLDESLAAAATAYRNA